MRTTIYSSVSHKVLTALVIAAMVLAALPVMPAFAAGISVTTTTDEFTSAGAQCSLREAIVLANNNGTTANDCTRSGIGDDDIITIKGGLTYVLSITSGTNAGDLDIGNAAGTSGSLTLQSDSSTPAIIDANDIDRVLDVDAMGNYSLTLINIIVTNGNTTGQATTAGGGISFAGTGTLTLIDSAVTSNIATNAAGCGAGIYNNSAATVVITNSTIDGNTCATSGSDGGGLFKGGGGTLDITNSTFSNNSTADNGGGANFAAGTVTIANSTFASNTAGNKGGGIQASGATVSVEFSTFSNNVASDLVASGNAGGAVQASNGSITVSTSILANSTGMDCDKSGASASVTLTNTLAENKGDCSGTPTSTLDPALGPLQNNGGPTETMAIGDTSPAYNAAASCGLFSTDQRGSTRPQAVLCDLGAYEVQNTNAPTVVSVLRAGSDPTNASSVDYTVTFSESVTGVDSTDFSLTETLSGSTSVTNVSGGGAVYTVTASTGTGSGTIRLNVVDDNTIIDIDTNSLDGGFTNGEVYTIDRVAPTTTSITRGDVNNPTNAASVSFNVTFSEPVSGVDSSDFLLTPTGVTGASITSVTGVGETYFVNVNTGSGDGSIDVDLKNSNNIMDLAGNAVSGGFTSGEVYDILKSVPYANVQVNIGGSSQGTYSVASKYSARPSYVDLDSGPVKVTSTLPVVTSERVAYSPDGGTTWTSHSELMGLPANLVHTSYTFPYYNNLDINSQLRFGNVGTVPTTVTVIIGGQNKGSFTVNPNASRRISYAGLSAGPVVIRSNGQPIIASMRVAYNDGTAWTSFSEMMGLPSNKLTNSYVFPWYNNATLDSQIRFGNVGTTGTTVTVTINGVVKGTYPLGPNQSQRVSYPGLDQGPVKITATSNALIIASMRVAYNNGTAFTDFSEMMGLPTNALSTSYSFPAYNNVAHNSQLRFGNVGTVGTNITVTINGVLKGTWQTAPNQSRRLSFPGLDSGPVVIQSSGGVPIIASLRVAYTPDAGVTWTSFAEMMGLPQSQLTTSYYFPWYNNLDLDTQLRFGIP